MIAVEIASGETIEMTWAEYRQLLLKALRIGQAPEVLLRTLLEEVTKDVEKR